jgi:nitroimidazol reductase NimA-like FMN-containing flavoprotein (pyridoxamine 5'-phosphate oxidase superfamily)
MPSRLLDWDTVDARLRGALHYWLATARQDGRPHVVPLDGIWMDQRWYFGGSPETVKHRNLLGNPNVALHLDGADAAVIVEGRCTVVEVSEEFADQLVAESAAKYGYAPPRAAYLSGVWALMPTKVLAWSDLTADATRFVFD